MFRIPYSILGRHLRTAIQSASGKAQTVVAPVTHRNGIFSQVRPMWRVAQTKPVRPVRTSVPRFPGRLGPFQNIGILGIIKPILVRKMSEGKPYAMAFEEARREAGV